MKNLNLGNVPEENFNLWIKMVGIHAAKRIEAGENLESAMQNGMKDYTAQLEKLQEFLVGDSKAKRELLDKMCEEIYNKIQEKISDDSHG